MLKKRKNTYISAATAESSESRNKKKKQWYIQPVVAYFICIRRLYI